MIRRWSPSARLFAVLAAVLGVAAFVLVQGYVREVEALAPALGKPVAVVVASRDLPRGRELSADMLRVKSMPSAFAPPGVIGRVEQAVGRALVSDLAAGEPLTTTRLGPTGAGPVASLVPPGLLAFVLATSLPPEAIRAGDRVDVLATYAGGQPYTETVVEGVEVLLVVARGDGGTVLPDVGGGGGPALVLLVDPYQAERLAFARAFANLEVAIGPADSGLA